MISSQTETVLVPTVSEQLAFAEYVSGLLVSFKLDQIEAVEARRADSANAAYPGEHAFIYSRGRQHHIRSSRAAVLEAIDAAAAAGGGGGGAGTVLSYVVLYDRKAANTPGGTFTSGAWQTRVLNTESVDTDDLCTLAANQFTLEPGTWNIFATAPAANGIIRHQTRLRDISAGVTAILGTSEAQGGSTQTRSILYGVYTFATATIFELQHRCNTTIATSGFGLASNFDEDELYSVVVAQRAS